MFLQHLEADARTVERTSAPAGRRGLEGRGKLSQADFGSALSSE